MITIQGFAKLCGCNTQTLRYYDRIGLLKPAKVDEWTGYRYYEEEQALLFVKIKNLQQVVVGVVFGYFTTFSNYLFSFLPTPDNLAVRLVMMLGSTVLIACGIFFYLPADIIPLAGEGAMKAISDTTNVLFSKVKIGFDVTMVAVSLTACLIVLKKFGSVGVGTVIAAVLVGAVLGVLNNLFGEKRDLLLAGNSAE